MADQNIAVTSPVKIDADSKQRVAFDLMNHIGMKCYDTEKGDQQTRAYWLQLYRQCYKAATGSPLESILRDE